MNTDAAWVRVRRMSLADLERVRAIAESLADAPHWPLVGFAVASLVGQQTELETIAVAAEGQRQGVGAKLFAALRVELRGAGAQEIILEVRASNHPALGLYRALGFAAAGRRPRYYADPVEDAVLMELRLG